MRFIRIGEQILRGNDDFAFWDTVRNKFFCASGDTVFSSIADLERHRGYVSEPTDHLPRSWDEMISMASAAVRQQDPED